VSESLSPTIRLVLQPDRRQRPERRSMWRGGRRSTDASSEAIDRRSADWESEEDLADEELERSTCLLH